MRIHSLFRSPAVCRLSSHLREADRRPVTFAFAIFALGIFLGLVTCLSSAAGQSNTSMTFNPGVTLTTEQLGGVPHPSEDRMEQMHKGPFILRARGGELTKVPAEKSALPFDPTFHPQEASLFRAHDSLIYVRQNTVLAKSTDGGHTWTSRKIEPAVGDRLVSGGKLARWQVLKDGTFVRVVLTIGEGATDPATVSRSQDEGRTWQQIGEISIDVAGGYKTRGMHWRMTKLPEETLFFCVDLRDDQYGADCFLTSGIILTGWRSDDGGKSWEGPIKMCDWAAEGGMVQLPSGKLLASVRYQRRLLPTDTPAVRQFAKNRGFKHLFLVESEDGGRSWKNLRPLTTVFGQCFGYPVAQSDGTFVVVHDTRYGPGTDAARAMISHDEGNTWEDEVYYLFFGKGATSYSKSVVLDDDTILTIGGTCTDPESKRDPRAPIGNSHVSAIRWKPVK